MELERLGPYQIVGKLGRGGMGIVFDAVHRETGEAAAVKLLSAALADDEAFRVRFEGEIETLRKLNHPNIVRLFGFGQQDGHLYYAMELVDGNSLEEELRRGRRFEWREVAKIGVEMCLALRHAHDRGVIHRDIKPGNVLLTDEEHIKLSDFGIARLFGNTRMTIAGGVVGTAEYMSPEQAAGQPVDARSDLYSLGALLYTLLAGRPVFRGKSLAELLQKQQFEPPEPVRKHVANVPEEFDHIVGELLEKEPARRVTNAGLLGRRLQAMLLALSVERETMQADAGWFEDERTMPGAGSGDSDAGGNPSTIAPTVARPVRNIAASDVSATQRPPETPEDERSAAAFDAVPIEAFDHPFHERGTFVPVKKDELDPLEMEESRPALISWQTWALIAALLAVGAGAWWSLQPPSADTLYGRIQLSVKDGSLDSLPRTGSEIDQLQRLINKFLTLYSGDRRAAQLQAYDKALRLRKLEWDFKRKTARAGLDGLLPIEQMYNSAINDAKSDPTVAVTKLKALIDLYGGSEIQPGPTEECLVLARQQLPRLESEAKRFISEQVAVLQERLAAADALRQTEPDEARKIYRAIIDLYGAKPWAADVVRRAREAIDKKIEPTS